MFFHVFLCSLLLWCMLGSGALHVGVRPLYNTFQKPTYLCTVLKNFSKIWCEMKMVTSLMQPSLPRMTEHRHYYRCNDRSCRWCRQLRHMFHFRNTSHVSGFVWKSNEWRQWSTIWTSLLRHEDKERCLLTEFHIGGCNEGGKGHNSPGAKKSLQCHKYFLQCTTLASETTRLASRCDILQSNI